MVKPRQKVFCLQNIRFCTAQKSRRLSALLSVYCRNFMLVTPFLARVYAKLFPAKRQRFVVGTCQTDTVRFCPKENPEYRLPFSACTPGPFHCKSVRNQPILLCSSGLFIIDVLIHSVILLCDRFTCIQSFRLTTKAEGRNFFTKFLLYEVFFCFV